MKYKSSDLGLKLGFLYKIYSYLFLLLDGYMHNKNLELVFNAAITNLFELTIWTYLVVGRALLVV